jgi:hypothetical protein
MRLFAFTAILALGVLIGLSEEKAGAGKNAPRPTPPPPAPAIPNWPQWQPVRPGGGGGAKVGKVTIDVTFTYNSDVGKVRSYDPPENFDDKGNVKKYTKEELADLKGDTPAEKKMVGYKADWDAVKVGDMVQVTLSVNKNAPPKAKKAKGKKDKEKEDAEADEKKEKEKEDKLAAKAAGKDGKWVTAAQFVAKVTRVDGGNSDGDTKMTVQIVFQQYGAGGNQKQTIDPDVAQATMIVIAKRPPEKAVAP